MKFVLNVSHIFDISIVHKHVYTIYFFVGDVANLLTMYNYCLWLAVNNCISTALSKHVTIKLLFLTFRYLFLKYHIISISPMFREKLGST